MEPKHPVMVPSMRKLIASILIIGMAIASLFSNPNTIHNGAAKNIRGLSNKSTGIHIDKELLINPNNKTKIILLFKDRESMEIGINMLPKTINLVHRFKIIPAILINARLKDLLSLGLDDILQGVYANKRYKLKPLNISIKGATTSDTAHTIGADIFWSNGYKGDGIRVCVIDTGINGNHTELEGKVVASKSFVLKKYGYSHDEANPSDVYGHGTMVAGIIAGKGINPKGQGMAPNAYLMNARVYASTGVITLSGIIAAIEWATFGPDGSPGTGDEADVINLSLGGGESYNSPTWLAIKKATSYGIVVVCAAGNEGDYNINSMSINDPANAPYAIAVGAVSPDYDAFDYYSSIGPTLFMVVKPEIAAPSDVYVLDMNFGYTGPVSGTSFSAPHVSGSIALILNYLNSKGVPKSEWAGIARSLILSTASPLIKEADTGMVKYGDMAIGSGLLNLSCAYDKLSSSGINSSYVPQWIDILPRRIPTGVSNYSSIVDEPYFPYFDRVFVNQTIVFNFSISSSKNSELSISIDGNVSNVLDLHSPTLISISAPVTYWEFNATVRSDASEGYYRGEIVFVDNNYGNVIRVPIEFNVVVPKAKVLLDLRHTSWTIDFRYGQYRLFVRELEKKYDFSVEQLFHPSHELTYNKISKYDVLLCPDATATEYVLYENGSLKEYFSDVFTSEEMEAIRKYIDNGGFLLIYALAGIDSGILYHNLTNLNELLKPYGIKFMNKYVRRMDNPVSVSTNGKHVLVAGIDELPYYGITLRVNQGLAEVILINESTPLAAIHMRNGSGGVLALGTNFVFDNWAIQGLYPGTGENGSNVIRFIRNMVNYLLYDRYIISDVASSSWNITRGENVTIKIHNTSLVMDVDCEYWSLFTMKKAYAMYSSADGAWVAFININIAGPAYIKSFAYRQDGYYVSSSIIINVMKTEENPPTITLVAPDNGSEIGVNPDDLEDIVIEFRVSDDTGIIKESLNVTVYGIDKYMLNVTETDEYLVVKIVIRGEDAINYIIYEELESLSIHVICYDVNINYDEATYIFYLKLERSTLLWILVILVIVIIMIIIVYLLLKY